MNKDPILQQLLEIVPQAQQGKISYERLEIVSRGSIGKHEFLFFIKPEITVKDPHIQFESILRMVLKKLDEYNLNIAEVSVLAADYLEQYDIIARHYGVINALSRDAGKHLSQEARDKFSQVYGKNPEQVQILGSIEFLRHFPSYTPQSLNNLWQKGEMQKLSGGTYCVPLRLKEQEVYLINGFHPNQLVHFTGKGKSIITFALTGDLDWHTARNSLIGKTNPSEALPGSLRNEIHVRKTHLGLSNVSASMNGFHLSAGPVEGLVELVRYCSNYAFEKERPITDFHFGSQLTEVFGREKTAHILGNPLLQWKESSISVFDLTEEKNNPDAIELLKNCKF
jgi:hypothetical protein